MSLTKDQIEKLCEGYDPYSFYEKHAYAQGRIDQAKKDAELCRKLCEKYFDHAKTPYEKCADAIERSIEGR